MIISGENFPLTWTKCWVIYMYYLSVYGVDPNRQLVGQLGSEGLCSYIHNQANQTLYVFILCTQSPKQQPLTLYTLYSTGFYQVGLTVVV